MAVGTRAIDRTDIIACYRAFLGRDPEAESAIEDKLVPGKTLEALLTDFVHSKEFTQRIGPSYANGVAAAFHANAGSSIEYDVSQPVMDKIIARIVSQWTAIGETEPYWGVLSSDEFKQKNMHLAMDRFYASGKREVDNVLAFCARNQVKMPTGVCLELGCGAGRVTRWLAECFEKVVGYDVAAPMLKLAEAHLNSEGRSNHDLRLLRRPSDLDRAGPCDFFFSVIVLQHNPPPIIRALLKSALEQLRRGGAFYFQLPTHFPDYRFSAEAYLRHDITSKGSYEMHALPMGVVLDLIFEAGCRIEEVIADNYAGGPGSHTFFGIK